MLIGSMNNPHLGVVKEVRWMSKNFDFLDLTLELPRAHPDAINVKELKVAIGKSPIVGHTAWYLPIGSLFKEIRLNAIVELEKCAGVFERLGASMMNVHPDASLPLKDEHLIDFNVWSLKRLVRIGRRHNMSIMLENTPGLFSKPAVLRHVFRKVPRLLFHLDVGHANIGQRNLTPFLVKKFSERLVHVHVSDNDGKGDDHLPIGKGSIDWPAMLGYIKKAGYDSTITLEVFTSPNARLADKPKLRRIWDKL